MVLAYSCWAVRPVAPASSPHPQGRSRRILRLQKGRLGFFAGGRAVTVEDRTRPVPNHLSCGRRSRGPLGAEAWEGRRLPPLGLRPAGLWVLRGSGRGGPCTEAPLAGGTQARGPRTGLAPASPWPGARGGCRLRSLPLESGSEARGARLWASWQTREKPRDPRGAKALRAETLVLWDTSRVL